ncbi:MAG: fatty acyl-AMP ligase [Deltaproteobacteria bacterium]|nr:fatty acyl-AMP ligase [Deltaproteobacteria bacterium]
MTPEVIISRFATYLHAFDDAVSARPADPLFTFLTDGTGDGVTWTYADLHREASRVAAMLRASVPASAPVLLMAPPGLEYLAGFYGCLYAGVIAVPAYPPSPMHGRGHLDRLQAIAADAGITFALITEAMRPALDGFSNGREPVRCLGLDEPSGPAESVPLPSVGADDLAFLQYTSGSTGDPKGVMVTQGNLVANISMIADMCDLSNDVIVSWLPPYHDMGLIGSLLAAPLMGARTVFMAPSAFLRRPARWLQAITHFGGTASTAPNFAYEACIERVGDAEAAELDLSTWRVAMNGAEPIRPSTMARFAERFAQCGFRPEASCPAYGLAETTLMATVKVAGSFPTLIDVDADAFERGRVQTASGDAPSRRFVSSGSVPAGTHLHIRDPETGAALEPGEIGEIVIEGPHVTAGYWRKPAVTSEQFSDGSVRTGDLGCLVDGELIVTGRMKDMMIIRGQNHYPQDIERTVEESHHGARHGCGVAFAVDRGDQEVLVVVQEVQPAKVGDPAELVEHIRRAVTAAHGVAPAAVVVARPGSVPKTSSGKVRRREARRLFLSGSLQPLFSWETAEPVGPARLLDQVGG